MAQPTEVSMADVLQQMVKMQLENENRAREREEKREKDRRIREVERARKDEQREEQSRRERERWEYEMRKDREERETKLLVALREAQPAVLQIVHISSTKLPKMTEGEDLQTFVKLFEAVMTDNHIGQDQWKAKIHAALDSATKLKVRDIITDADSTYADLIDALIGCGTLTFSHASENLLSAERGKTLNRPLRQAVQKWQRLLEKITAEATTIKEACTYVAVAIARYNTNPELKMYLDMKGDFAKDLFCGTAEEWLANKPGGTRWAKKHDYGSDGSERPASQHTQRPVGGRKPGECYFCGKPGHYAQECRSRLSRERQRQNTPISSPVTQSVRQKPTSNNQTVRNLADFTCFKCRQKGHISPDCPKKTNRIKRMKIPEEKMVPLR